ncbi:MAG: TSUP family transporter [Thiothrix sp.]
MELLLALFIVAMLAGWVDAIGGGGGLLCIPALLWGGFTPLETLATNKLQASFGSATATLNYTRHGLVDWRGQKLAIALTFTGAVCGTLLVQQLDASVLTILIPLLLIGFALYFGLSPHMNNREHCQRISPALFAATVGFGVGCYDGFFGPGTGTFFTMGYIALLGYGLPRATGNTKLLNFTSNFASLLCFALSGQIVWLVGLVMGVGQILGGYLGSAMAVKRGTTLIRPVLITVALLSALKLLITDH